MIETPVSLKAGELRLNEGSLRAIILAFLLASLFTGR